MSGWAQIDELFIALLESDEVFNLEPVFSPATSGTMFSGLTSQKLPIALTFQANRITRLEFTYQQLGEIPPNPQCRHEISVDLSVPVATDGTFDADISVPPTVSDSGKLQVVVFEGRLKGTLGDFLATADWDFTELEVVCETSNGRIRRHFCGANFFSCLDAVDFSFELERNVGDF